MVDASRAGAALGFRRGGAIGCAGCGVGMGIDREKEAAVLGGRRAARWEEGTSGGGWVLVG